ncbi:ferritin family protein [Alkalibacter rhizosphaerae]|uniref:Ferritin family protein n=1 Tax=Alkalibacter rhizosphaerae TaxID=2815577 RepID=A0A974XFE8_9FIRM|nr:ferritin family protein [Alkalibacter rhizosphaerae]QSX08756.1 ferritin family protein [Alkalibacter rhizosphaerae]
MSLYDVALKMETDSRAFYLKQAEASENEGLKQIFHKLADDEKRHYEYVRGLGFVNEDFVETDVLVDVKNVFTKLLEDQVFFDMELSTIEAYEFAKKMERESAEYYRNMQDQTEDEKTIKILKMLEREEKKHLLTLEDIILYMQKPETWVEDAEFTIREEY